MYLLKKIVGFGSGRASIEASADEDSRPVTPEDAKNEHKPPKKKKKKKGSKKEKIEKEDEEISRITDEDDETAPVENHVIPEIFFEEFSETDKSKDDTSKDMSSSDLSDVVPENIDFWADRGAEISGEASLTSADKIAENIQKEPLEEVDFWDKNASKTMSDEFEDTAEKETLPAKDSTDFSSAIETENAGQEIASLTSEDKISGNFQKESSEEVDFWGESEEREKIDSNEREGSEPALEQFSLVPEVNFWGEIEEGKKDVTKECDEDNIALEKSPDVDFWGDTEEKQRDAVEMEQKDDSIHGEDQKEEIAVVDDFWAEYDEEAVFSARKASLDEINIRRGSKTSSASPEKSLKKSPSKSSRNSKSSSPGKSKKSSVSPSKSQRDSKSMSREKSADSSMSASVDPSKSESPRESPERSTQSFKSGKSRKSSKKSSVSPVKSVSSTGSHDGDESGLFMSLADESRMETSDPYDENGNNCEDSLWAEDDLPPIFEISKNKSPSLDKEVEIPKDNDQAEEKDTQKGTDWLEDSFSQNDETSEEEVPGGKIDRPDSLEPSTQEEDVTETAETESGKLESESESSDDSPETLTENSGSQNSTSTEERSKGEEKMEPGAPEVSKLRDSSSPEAKDQVDDVPKRNFTKAIQDFESHSRRKSVVIPDARERTESEYIPTPPPLPSSPPPFPRSPQSSDSGWEARSRTRHISETSTEGEGHDDGIMDYLGKENDRAEARLAARRQARVEAREIRMRELERVQREQDENSDRVLDAHCTTPPHINNIRQPSMSPRDRPTPNNSYHSSRRSSEDSMDDGLGLRDMRHELKEAEEKFRKAMIANAQLDNEKAAHAYQVELLKDRIEDLEEAYALLNREHKERCREHESLKRSALKLREDLGVCTMCLEERDRLIADYGLIIVGGEPDETGEATPRALVSAESAEMLENAGNGSLDVRLKALANEKNDLADEVRHLKLLLEEEQNKRRHEQSLSNGPLTEDVQQTLNDYKFRLQKAEQDTSTLQANVARLESQVIRYKAAAEESEKAEEELKKEKRNLLREHRETIARLEELETSNSHLQRRMDKLKNAKSTLLKEL